MPLKPMQGTVYSGTFSVPLEDTHPMHSSFSLISGLHSVFDEAKSILLSWPIRLGIPIIPPSVLHVVWCLAPISWGSQVHNLAVVSIFPSLIWHSRDCMHF